MLDQNLPQVDQLLTKVPSTAASPIPKSLWSFSGPMPVSLCNIAVSSQALAGYAPNAFQRPPEGPAQRTQQTLLCYLFLAILRAYMCCPSGRIRIKSRICLGLLRNPHVPTWQSLKVASRAPLLSFRSPHSGAPLQPLRSPAEHYR